MGKVVTPKFRVEYYTNDSKSVKTMIWEVKSRANVTGYGKPSFENLEKWRTVYNKSFLKDGVNFHISESAGMLVHIGRCKIVNQFTGRVVVEYKPPLFEIF